MLFSPQLGTRRYQRVAAAGGDPNWASVTALLHFEGADASTTFTDQRGHTFTPQGNAQIDTAQFKFGAASGLFDGTGDGLSTGVHDDFKFPGDFTVEGFFRIANLKDTALFSTLASDSATGFQIYIITAGAVRLYTGSADRINSGPGVISTATQYHIAITRSGTDSKLFVDGGQVGSTYTDSANYSDGDLWIGGNYAGGAYDGWVDEFRITKGVARYTSNFTPPSEAFPDS